MKGLPWQDAELKAEKYGGKTSKTLEKLGCKNYASKYGMLSVHIYSCFPNI
jgi:hypothetical protein